MHNTTVWYKQACIQMHRIAQLYLISVEQTEAHPNYVDCNISHYQESDKGLNFRSMLQPE